MFRWASLQSPNKTDPRFPFGAGALKWRFNPIRGRHCADAVSRQKSFLDVDKRIALTVTDAQPPYIEVETLDGYSFITGPMQRHQFRFAQILDWIRRHIQPPCLIRRF